MDTLDEARQLTGEDRHWLKRMEDSFSALSHWLETDNLSEVSDGSALAGDNRESLGVQFRGSDLAWFGLEDAFQHLQFIEEALSNGCSLRPFAYATLTRSALMASSQTVWLLSPASRAERISRALRVNVDEAHQLRSFVRDYEAVESSNEDVNGAIRSARGVADRVDRDIKRLKGERAFGGYPGATKILQSAVAYVVENDNSPESDWLSPAWFFEWRLNSAHAHGRMWPVRFMPVLRETDGQVTAEFRGTVPEIGRNVVAAFLMTGEAMKLWNQRRLKQR